MPSVSQLEARRAGLEAQRRNLLSAWGAAQKSWRETGRVEGWRDLRTFKRFNARDLSVNASKLKANRDELKVAREAVQRGVSYGAAKSAISTAQARDEAERLRKTGELPQREEAKERVVRVPVRDSNRVVPKRPGVYLGPTGIVLIQGGKKAGTAGELFKRLKGQEVILPSTDAPGVPSYSRTKRLYAGIVKRRREEDVYTRPSIFGSLRSGGDNYAPLAGLVASQAVAKAALEAKRPLRLVKYESDVESQLSRERDIYEQISPYSNWAKRAARDLTFGKGLGLEEPRGPIGETSELVVSNLLQIPLIVPTVPILAGRAGLAAKGLFIPEARGEVITAAKEAAIEEEAGPLSYLPGGTRINPEGYSSLIFASIPAVAKAGSNFITRAGAKYVPQVKPGQTVKQVVAEFKAEPVEGGFLVGTASPKPLVGETVLRGASSEEGLFVTPPGRGSPWFLGLGGKGESPSVTFSFFPKLTKPTFTEVVTTGVERIPMNVLTAERGFVLSNLFLSEQAGTGRVYLTKSMESYINKRIPTTRSTPETEGLLPKGTALVKEAPETFLGKVRGYDKYTIIQGKTVPIKRIRAVSDEVVVREPFVDVAKVKKGAGELDYYLRGGKDVSLSSSIYKVGGAGTYIGVSSSVTSSKSSYQTPSKPSTPFITSSRSTTPTRSSSLIPEPSKSSETPTFPRKPSSVPSVSSTPSKPIDYLTPSRPSITPPRRMIDYLTPSRPPRRLLSTPGRSKAPPPRTFSDSGKKKRGVTDEFLLQEFLLLVRRRGRFRRVRGGLTKAEALRLGVDITSGSTASTFRLKETGGRVSRKRQDWFGVDPRKYRPYSVRKGRPRAERMTYIEKQRKRLTTKAERSALQRARGRGQPRWF